MLVHLQIISAESDKITESKLNVFFLCQAGFVKKKVIFSRLAFVYILSGQLKSCKWKQHTRSGLFVAQKKLLVSAEML